MRDTVWLAVRSVLHNTRRVVGLLVAIRIGDDVLLTYGN